MSMDLVVWTACTIALPADLPESTKWKNHSGPDWAYESSAWQVIVEPDPSRKKVSEVLARNPQFQTATVVVLEPLGANREGYAFLETVARSIAKRCGGGVIEGPAGLILLNANGEDVK